MAMLDTLRASQQLQEAGIEAGHADALVTTFSEGFAERLATRDELRAEIASVRAEIREAEQRALNRAYVALGAATTLLVAVISIATTVIVALN